MLTTSKRGKGWRGAVWAAAAGVTLVMAGCMPPGPKALLDGERLLGQGRVEEAIRRLRTAVGILPSNAQAWNHLGLAYHRGGRPAEAAEAYDRALRLDRNLTVAYFNLGCLHLEQGQPVLAADTLWAYVGLQPRVVEGWVKLGQAQLRLGRWEQAERSFLEALRLHPARVEALNGVGVAYHQRQRVREAWQSFTNAVTRDPNFAPGWLNLGVIAQEHGAKGQAVQAYRYYAGLRPERARQLDLAGVIRRLETPPAPVNPPSPGSPTNAPVVPASASPAASVPAAAPQAAVTSDAGAVASASGASASETNTSPAKGVAEEAVASLASASQAPSEPRPPPVQASVTVSPEDASGSGEATPRPASTSAPTAAPVPVLAASGQGPAEGEGGPGSQAAPASAQVSSNVPESFVLPVTSPVPGDAEVARPSNEVAVASVATPLERVEVPPTEPIVVEVRDESTEAPLFREVATEVAEGGAAEESLVRPVAAQRSVAAVEKKGFWSRANPVNWFGSENASAAADAETSPESERRASEGGTEGGGWKWANPATWFRSEPALARSETDRVPSSDGPKPAMEPVTNAMVVADPGIPVEAIKPEDKPRTVASLGSARPIRETAVEVSSGGKEKRVEPKAVVEVVPEVRRYTYLRPKAPDAGDRWEARGMLTQAMQEHRRERFASAVKLYEESLRLDPSFTEAWQNLAVAAMQVGDLPRALSAGETALVLQPMSTGARLNFALALDQAGFPLDAALEAERVVAAKPDDVAAHLLLGNVNAQKLGRPERARTHYMRVIELEPEHPQSVAIRRWLAGRS